MSGSLMGIMTFKEHIKKYIYKAGQHKVFTQSWCQPIILFLESLIDNVLFPFGLSHLCH